MLLLPLLAAYQLVVLHCRLTALPVRVAHLEVTAGSGWVLAGSIGAADLLDLLAKTLQGGVDLQVTVTQNISIISAEQTEGIRGLLLGLGNEAKVEATTRGARWSGRSGRSGRTLREKNSMCLFPWCLGVNEGMDSYLEG